MDVHGSVLLLNGPVFFLQILYRDNRFIQWYVDLLTFRDVKTIVPACAAMSSEQESRGERNWKTGLHGLPVRFRYLGKFWCGFAIFGPPLRGPLKAVGARSCCRRKRNLQEGEGNFIDSLIMNILSFLIGIIYSAVPYLHITVHSLAKPVYANSKAPLCFEVSSTLVKNAPMAWSWNKIHPYL